MIRYKIISRPNPQNRTIEKFYLSPVYSGAIELEELSKLMSDGSTVREADIYAVLIGMANAVSQQLAQGKIVRLGKLGTFRVGFNSKGSDLITEAKPALIRYSKIRYYPAKGLQEMLKQLVFRKYG